MKLKSITPLATAAALAVAGSLPIPVVSAQTGVTFERPALDGNLADLKSMADQAQQVVTRGIALQRTDNFSGGETMGEDGFQDQPLEASATPLDRFMHSPINVGSMVLVYSPDSDGVVEPAWRDDSWLAIGVNIANGDGDVFDESIKLLTPPDLPTNIMVPFDADGNGDPATLGIGEFSRWFPGQPLLTFDEALESLTLSFFLCAENANDLTGPPSFELAYSQANDAPTVLSLFNLDPESVNVFPPVGSTCEDIRQRGLDHVISFPDGLGNDDFEFLIDRIDSQVHALFPGDEFETQTRLRLGRLGVAVHSEASADLSNGDAMYIVGAMQTPQIEVRKLVRCFGEDESAWRPTIESTACELVEFRIDVENTGDMAVLLTLTDVITAFGATDVNVINGTLTATLHRPANAPGFAIDFNNAANFNLNPVFFTPSLLGFLGGVVSGQPRQLGRLSPADVCTGAFTVLGDRVELRYRANISLPPDFCELPRLALDVHGAITAVGTMPNGDVVTMDEPLREPDVPREILAGGDDGEVTVDLLCDQGVPCPTGNVEFVDPPADAVDARAPFLLVAPDVPLGLDTFIVRAPRGAESGCWSLCESASTDAPNEIVAVIANDETYTVHLSRPITPGATTQLIYHNDSGTLTIGSYHSHPANVDADSAASPLDILRLIDCLNEVDAAASCPWGMLSQDIDHSGALTPNDILTVIDLLNGADAFAAWNGTSRPPADCQP